MKPLDSKYIEDKKALFKDIIRGKERPSSFRELIHQRKLIENPPVKPRQKTPGINDWVKYIKK